MLKLQVDPGGEWLIPFCKTQLRALKAWMKEAGITNFVKNLVFSSGERAQLYVYEYGIDRIRITAPKLSYLFYGSVYPSFSFSEVLTAAVPHSDGLLTGTLSLRWPDASEFVVGTGTRQTDYITAWQSIFLDYVLSYDAQTPPSEWAVLGARITGTFNNYLGGSTAPVQSRLNGVQVQFNFGIPPTAPADWANSDSMVYSFTDLRDTIITQTRAKIGTATIDPLVQQVFDAGHPTVGGVLTYADGETMTLVELDYTYIPDVRTETGPPLHDGVDTPTPPARTDGAYYSSTSGITAVTLARATTYTYHSDTATWTVGATRVLSPAPTYPTTTHWGDVVVMSKSPVTGQGVQSDELESTYTTQATTLAALDPSVAPLTANKLLRAVQLALV